MREKLLLAISPSMRNAIAIGIGLFITLIGLRNAGLVLNSEGTGRDDEPAACLARFDRLLLRTVSHRIADGPGVRGAIVWGILGGTALAVALKVRHPVPARGDYPVGRGCEIGVDDAVRRRNPIVSAPPSMGPTFLKMDLVNALSWSMVPFILIFLFMGRLRHAGDADRREPAGRPDEDGTLPRAKEAMMSDAIGTVAGAGDGDQHRDQFHRKRRRRRAGRPDRVDRAGRGRAVSGGVVFQSRHCHGRQLSADHRPGPGVVGSMMLRNVTQIDWDNYAEALPAFLIMVGIPFTYSIADGLALGLIAYPVVKLAAGQGRDVKGMMYLLAVVMVAYFIFLRAQAG